MKNCRFKASIFSRSSLASWYAAECAPNRLVIAVSGSDMPLRDAGVLAVLVLGTLGADDSELVRD
jgi:hypothetical protein